MLLIELPRANNSHYIAFMNLRQRNHFVLQVFLLIFDPFAYWGRWKGLKFTSNPKRNRIHYIFWVKKGEIIKVNLWYTLPFVYRSCVFYKWSVAIIFCYQIAKHFSLALFFFFVVFFMNIHFCRLSCKLIKKKVHLRPLKCRYSQRNSFCCMNRCAHWLRELIRNTGFDASWI